ncbi:DoxX family protein [Paenibacillus humicola]|uniref:DoxX family protein n=1 Tax=Paenibacillus humicola TaxID=3110540 RepID=UPI00237B74D9|nr:DoxX family protein [Paenibacillus humicola]
MKKIAIPYWMFTGLLAAFMFSGSIPDLLSTPDAVELFNQLGYPAYLLPFLGVAKILGVIALFIPGFPRVKEWVYAGFVYDLAGAMYSTLASGGPVGGSLFFLLGFAMIAGSYIYHHRRLKAASFGAGARELRLQAGNPKYAE